MNAILKFCFGCLVACGLAAVAPAADDPVTLPGLEDQHAGLTREDVLTSKDWRQTMLSLSAWFNQQQMYTPEQVIDFKREINRRVKDMTPTELMSMQHEIAQKLTILNGEQARQVRLWLREQLSLVSDDYARQVKGGLPDISRITPDELQDYLNDFVMRINAQKRGSQELASARAAQADMVTNKLAMQRREADRAIDAAVARGRGVVGSRNVSGPESPWGIGGVTGGRGGWGGWGGGWGAFRW
jgi:hypothetical protein